MKPLLPIEQYERVAVVGFGRSGQAVARYLAARGIGVMVSETRTAAQLSATERSLLHELSAEFEGGDHTERFLLKAGLIVVGPGVDYGHSALVAARKAGIEVIGELALAAACFCAPVIGVTGTNGKTTVTELIGALLKAAGKRVFVGGNIGTPIGEYLLAPDGYQVVVLEVSSFQLEQCGAFAPQVAVLLNITPDHLDRHKTLVEYAGIKMNIFKGVGAAGAAIINNDDPLCSRFRSLGGRDSFLLFGSHPECDAVVTPERVTLTGALGNRSFDLAGSQLAGLPGAMNFGAALLAVQMFGLKDETIRHTLRDFRIGAHRMQVVAERAGVTYIDDSKATNTGAVNSALRQIGARIILIAGGKDKGDDFRLLRDAVAECVKHLVLIGEAARKIGAALGDVVPLEYASTMEEAVRAAEAVAVAGDTVLLSPGCASFDMFLSYSHRGECFTRVVERAGDIESCEETR